MQLAVQRQREPLRTHALNVRDSSVLHLKEVQRREMSMCSAATTVANASRPTFRLLILPVSRSFDLTGLLRLIIAFPIPLHSIRFSIGQ
jgi:hypothetical protein